MTDPVKEASLYINKIMEERCILVASPEDHDASIMTAIIDILDDENEVVFDYSGSKDLDRRIRQSQSIGFSTCIDDIKVTFSSGPVEDTVHRGRPAFKIKMPRSIYRVQRRDFYRVSPPLLERPECVMEYDGKSYKATILDISIGGINALIQNSRFKAGDVIERCRISTPIGIKIEASLEIIYVRNELDRSREAQYGCVFKDAGALVESKLQRYVTYLQGKELEKRREPK
ncbi:MAG: flagellar brake protein [Candidatus Promineifilaceae bacterium]